LASDQISVSSLLPSLPAHPLNSVRAKSSANSSAIGRLFKLRVLFCAEEFPASLKLASDITSDITERLFKRGIAANS
jgi:hypothetical protein